MSHGLSYVERRIWNFSNGFSIVRELGTFLSSSACENSHLASLGVSPTAYLEEDLAIFLCHTASIRGGGAFGITMFYIEVGTSKSQSIIYLWRKEFGIFPSSSDTFSNGHFPKDYLIRGGEGGGSAKSGMREWC